MTNHFAAITVDNVTYNNEEFTAMKDNGEYGYPEFDVSEALTEGKIQQFFEQAFEWNNMLHNQIEKIFVSTLESDSHVLKQKVCHLT